jgi:hypothetical protein
VVRREREGEEEVSQSVRPGEELGRDRFGRVQGDEISLRPARDGSGDMEASCRGRAARERERGEGRVARLEPVDVSLEPLDMASEDPLLRRPGGRVPSKLGLGDVQLVLEPTQDGADLPERVGELGERDPEGGSELVVPAVGADAERVLGYARPAGKTGRSAIARPSVEPRDALASGRPRSSSRGELNPWTGQNEMWSTSLCFASCRHSRQMNPLRSLQAIPIASMPCMFNHTGG